MDELQRIDRLANYNSEVARGIAHTTDWREKMKREQEWFDREILRREVKS